MSLANFSSLWDRASAHDLREGMLAYFRYRETLQTFADFYGFGLVPTVEVFAATSPNNDYHGNLRSTASVLHAVKHGIPPALVVVSCYQSCANRAYGYASGRVSFQDTVGGLKIRAFRHNLLYPDTSREVTVDGHMFAAWVGDDSMTMKQAALLVGRSKDTYAEVAEDIRKLARKHGLIPHQVQSTLWIARKRLLGIKYNTQMHFDHGSEDLSRIRCNPKDYLPFPLRENTNSDEITRATALPGGYKEVVASSPPSGRESLTPLLPELPLCVTCLT